MHHVKNCSKLCQKGFEVMQSSYIDSFFPDTVFIQVCVVVHCAGPGPVTPATTTLYPRGQTPQIFIRAIAYRLHHHYHHHRHHLDF